MNCNQSIAYFNLENTKIIELKSDIVNFSAIIEAAGWIVVQRPKTNVYIVSCPVSMSRNPIVMVSDLQTMTFEPFIIHMLALIDVVESIVRIQVCPAKGSDRLQHFFFAGCARNVQCAYDDVGSLQPVSIPEAQSLSDLFLNDIITLLVKHADNGAYDLNPFSSLHQENPQSFESLGILLRKKLLELPTFQESNAPISSVTNTNDKSKVSHFLNFPEKIPYCCAEAEENGRFDFNALDTCGAKKL